jgi:hypothetical protein
MKAIVHIPNILFVEFYNADMVEINMLSHGVCKAIVKNTTPFKQEEFCQSIIIRD